jgi:HlyD family secretion protein
MRAFLYVCLTIMVTAGVAYAGWRYVFPENDSETIVLHGNVDLRQVDLPFNGQQRVAAVYVEEGGRVAAGALLAKLETPRLEAAVAEARARVEGQRRVIERMENGTRPEEVAQARARVEAAAADLANARVEHERLRGLAGTGAASAKEIDAGRYTFESAAARLKVEEHALELAIAGPRAEDKAEAEANLSALEAQLALKQRELADAELRSPVTGIVRNRILEPGEMAQPGAAAITIAVTDPKWVRAYVNETDLGKVRPGGAAAITVDAFPGRTFTGWVGFVSPVAEFTPKNVETPELRTSLVYEVRVFFRDPGDALRLGMPATVSLRPGAVSGPTTRAAR